MVRLVFLGVLATTIPIPVLAQGVIVQGRVFEFGSTTVVWNARVELEGHGATLTSIAGTFRFDDVEPGGYTLRVEAFGYCDSELLRCRFRIASLSKRTLQLLSWRWRLITDDRLSPAS